MEKISFFLSYIGLTDVKTDIMLVFNEKLQKSREELNKRFS